MPVLLALLLVSAVPLDEDPAFLEGLAAFKELKLEEAALGFQRAALDDSRPSHERARVQMWLGATYGQLGDLSRARSSFAFAFALSPDAILPVRVSPKVTAVLEAERNKARLLREAAVPPTESADPPAATSTTPAGETDVDAPAPAPVGSPAAAVVQPPAAEGSKKGRGRATGWFVVGGLAGAGAVLIGLVAGGSGALAAGFWSVASNPSTPQIVAEEAYLVYQVTLASAVGMGAIALALTGAAAGTAVLGVTAE